MADTGVSGPPRRTIVCIRCDAAPFPGWCFLFIGYCRAHDSPNSADGQAPFTCSSLAQHATFYIYIYRCKKALKWGQRTRRHATLSFELVSIGKKNPHWQRTRDGPLCLWVSVLQPWWLDLPLSWGPFSRRCFLVYRKGALRDFAPRELA